MWVCERDFNPHSPCGERLVISDNNDREVLFQSTLPMRGATSSFASSFCAILISIHTPHAGSDNDPSIPLCNPATFQSTLPMRGATFSDNAAYNLLFDFNPHSPCGERLCCCCGYPSDQVFQSTLPMRGATIFPSKDAIAAGISIHTPHAGSDPLQLHCCSLAVLISIHTPHAGSDPFL